MTQATGTFEVKMTPADEPRTESGVSLGRMALGKVFSGDLQATGQGEMLTALTGVDGSAGYVALERVTGSLHGRRGSFVLQHHGLTDRGTQHLSITIVPDSGTGELTGLTGTLSISIVEGRHHYVLAYELPA
jgi:hypothetical protein